MKTIKPSILFLLLTLSLNTYSQSTPQEFFNNGLEAFYGARFQDGIKYFDTYIKSMPNDFQGFKYRGLCYQGMKNFPRSIEDFTSAIRVSPRNSDGYLNRGNSYYFSKNYHAASRDYDDALRLDSRNFEAYFGKARVFLDTRKFDQALKEVNLAEGVDPMNARVYLNKSFVHMQLLDTADMFEDIATALYYDSNIVFTDYRRDLLYVKVENYKNALAIVNSLIQQNPGSYMYIFARGFIYFLLNNFPLATEDLKKAVEMNKDPSSRFIEVINKIARSIDQNSN